MSGDRRSIPEGKVACRRTSSVIDRIVSETLTPADRDHAATCPDCGPVLARSVRFDDALRRAARGIVAEELPSGILAPGLVAGPDGVRHGPALRGFAPGLAGMAAAVMILVLATGIALAPGGFGGPTISPPVESSFAATVPLFRTSAALATDLRGLGYQCGPGGALPTVGSRPGQAEREGLVCVTQKDDPTKQAALITGETGASEVVRVTIKGEPVGTDPEAAIEELATAFAKLTFISIVDPVAAPVAGNWVNAELPKLTAEPANDTAVNVIGGIRLTLERSALGGYLLVLEPAAGG